MEYKTPPQENDGDAHHKFTEQMPDIQLMCVDRQKLLQLCDLFPQTAENIKQRAKERRIRFMEQKNQHSISYQRKVEKIEQEAREKNYSEADKQKKIDHIPEEFYTDEEPESLSTNKEDMKVFLNNMNKRIDVLVDTLKECDNMICKQSPDPSSKSLLDQIKEKRLRKKNNPQDVLSAYKYFKDKIKQSQ